MTDPPWWREYSGGALPVDGGIRARSTRGAIGRSWWSGRFIAVLESLGVGGRLGRGRAYARAGQVVSMEVDVGSVKAQVQGSRPQPYRVRLGIRTYGKSEWALIEQAMADDAWYAAKLLAGEMPEDIEEQVFGPVGLGLFPTSRSDLSMDCTCPDGEVPCKHLAAVCYLLAESFDDDPFGILALRGRDRETLLANVRARRATGPPGGGTAPSEASADGPESIDPPARLDHTAPLAECLDRYWSAPGPLPGSPAPETPVDAVLDELPPAGLAVGGRTLTELLRPTYRALADPE